MIPFLLMPSRPLHRWKSLWLGIPVISFFGLAWRESMQSWTLLIYRQCEVSHAGSGTCFKYSGPKSPSILPMQWSRMPIYSWQPLWHSAFESPAIFRGNGQPGRIFSPDGEMLLGTDFRPRNSAEQHYEHLIWSNTAGSLAIFIPHWLSLTAFLLPWSAFLGWRWRRSHRLTEAAA